MPRHSHREHKRSSRRHHRRRREDEEDVDAEPLPEPPLLHVYAASTCTKPRYRHHHLHLMRDDALLGAPLCGYALVAPAFNLRVAEPVPGGPQSHHRADLAALHAALELVHGLRVRDALIYIRSSRLVAAYEAHGDNPDDPPQLAANDTRVWDAVAALRATLADRGVSLTLLAYPPPDPDELDGIPIASDAAAQMRVARRLAKQAKDLHVKCPLCDQLHGRQFKSHECRPICRIPPCNGGVVYPSVDAYKRHVLRRHAVRCKRSGCDFFAMSQAELDEHVRDVHGGLALDCPFCGKGMRDQRALTRHIRRHCHEAPRCPECDKRFDNEEELERHMRRTGMLTEPGHGHGHGHGFGGHGHGHGHGGHGHGHGHGNRFGGGGGGGGSSGGGGGGPLRAAFRRRRGRNSSAWSSSTSSTSSYLSDEDGDVPGGLGFGLAAGTSPALTGGGSALGYAAYGAPPAAAIGVPAAGPAPGGSGPGSGTDVEEFEEDEFGLRDPRRANSMHAAFGRPDVGW